MKKNTLVLSIATLLASSAAFAGTTCDLTVELRDQVANHNGERKTVSLDRYSGDSTDEKTCVGAGRDRLEQSLKELAEAKSPLFVWDVKYEYRSDNGVMTGVLDPLVATYDPKLKIVGGSEENCLVRTFYNPGSGPDSAYEDQDVRISAKAASAEACATLAQNQYNAAEKTRTNRFDDHSTLTIKYGFNSARLNTSGAIAYK